MISHVLLAEKDSGLKFVTYPLSAIATVRRVVEFLLFD